MKVVEKAASAINGLHVNACAQVKVSLSFKNDPAVPRSPGNSFAIQKFEERNRILARDRGQIFERRHNHARVS